MSAFNTRTVKSPHMFVRTHVAFYFVSLLVSDILQCEFLSLFVHPPLRYMRPGYGAWTAKYETEVFPLCWSGVRSPDATADLPYSFRSDRFHHQRSMGARQGRYLRHAVYSAR